MTAPRTARRRPFLSGPGAAPSLALVVTAGAFLGVAARSGAQDPAPAPASAAPAGAANPSTSGTASPTGSPRPADGATTGDQTAVGRVPVNPPASAVSPDRQSTTLPVPPTAPAAPPSNPLVIVDPQHRSGNPTVYYDRYGNLTKSVDPNDRDYRQDATGRAQDRRSPLPLFGYSYFEPARRIIEARRRALEQTGLQNYGPDATGYGPNPPPQGPGAVPGGRQAGPGTAGAFPAAQPGTAGDGAPYGAAGGTLPNGAFQNGLNGANLNGLNGAGPNAPGATAGMTDATALGAAALGGAALGSQGRQGQAALGNAPSDPGAVTDAQGTFNAVPSVTGALPTPGTAAGGFSQPTPGQPGPGGAAAGGYYAGPRVPSPYSRYGAAPGGYSTGGYASGGYDNGGYDNGGYGSTGYGSTGYDSTGYDAGSGGPYPPRRTANAYNTIVDPLTQLYQNVTATVTPSYQLEPGDTLTIRYASPTVPARQFDRTVDPQGGIVVAGMEGAGRIIVRGLSAAQAENLLRARLQRYYRNADVSITLKELRTYAVTLTGLAYEPGTYQIPATTTALNLLQATGGPTEDGSLRDIEVRRAGRLVGRIDFYKYYLSTAPVRDINLQPGDQINIPPRLSRVTLRGEVRQPAVFELRENEHLADALRYAGGIKPSGVAQHVQINTLDPGAARVLNDVDAHDKAVTAQTPLYDGDQVEVFSVRALVVNRVTVEGAVDQPGDYALQPNMRVSDLLAAARSPLYDASLSRADLYRLNADNTTTLIPINVEKALAHDPANDVALARWDRLKLYRLQDVAWTGRREVEVRGAVQRPGVYTLSQNMRVQDLLIQAGGPTPDAATGTAILEHQHPDGSFKVDTFNLAQAAQGDSAQNLPLEDNDILALYKVGEDQFTPNHTVTIRGQVGGPGTYPRGEGMKLSDLLRIAGRFRPGASTEVTIAHARRLADEPNLRVSRATFDSRGLCAPGDDATLEDGDVVMVQGNGAFRPDVSFVEIDGAVARPGPYPITDKTRLSDLLNAAGGLRPEAFPEGAEFTRNPALMSSSSQRTEVALVNGLNNLLNASEYKRELAKSDIDRIKAVGAAAVSQTPLPLLGAGAPAPTVNPATGTFAGQLAQRDLVSTPRALNGDELQPNGNIAVNLAAAQKRPGGSEDITLVDGDRLVVPVRPTTVQVVGAVYNARGVKFRPGASPDYYISQAGGLAPDAATDRIEVVHAGGGLVPANRAGALQPGDLILVPTHVLAARIASGGNSFGSFFQSLTSSAITIKVLTSVFGL